MTVTGDDTLHSHSAQMQVLDEFGGADYLVATTYPKDYFTSSLVFVDRKHLSKYRYIYVPA